MPRAARVKKENAVYHIMSRSISEINLFKSDKDKAVYLRYVRKYKEIFSFKVYAFCIMDNHTHFLIDANGSDISKFMHCINQCYSQYFNKKYNRHGHLFAGRFKSKIADTNSSVLNISAYIHNNPKDIKGYYNSVENYTYSSFGIYLGKFKDKFSMIDKQFILECFQCDPIISLTRYKSFVKSRIGIYEKEDSQNDKFIDKYCPSYEYKSYKNTLLRNACPEKIINFVSNFFNLKKFHIHIKYNRYLSEFRSICVFLIRNLCNFKLVDIAHIIKNITLSSLSRLCHNGYNLITDNPKYQNIIDTFLDTYNIYENNSC